MLQSFATIPGKQLQVARAAVATGFMLSGAGFASWVVRIPDAQQRLDLSEGALGLTLLGMSAGGFLAMPLSAALIARFGSRRVALGATLSLAAAVTGPAHAPTPLALALVLLVLGAASSVMAVALNTQAAEVERRMGRPIMAGLHALFSLGGLIGAGLGGLVADTGVGAGAHLGVTGLAIAGLGLASGPLLLDRKLEAAPTASARARPGRALLLLGLIAFCVLFSEGAVADWSTIYLRDAAGAGPALAAAGYAAFSLMMAAGRFVGDALTVRLGPARLVRVGGATAALGIALAVTQSQPWIAVAGFGLVGAGLSSVFPTLVAAAGRTPGAPASSSIAVVSSIGYAGLLAGPPLIGMIGEALSLRLGVGAIGLAALLIAALAGILAPVTLSEEGDHAGLRPFASLRVRGGGATFTAPSGRCSPR
jgi:predicted MFS family arabinose efflux permease